MQPEVLMIEAVVNLMFKRTNSTSVVITVIYL